MCNISRLSFGNLSRHIRHYRLLWSHTLTPTRPYPLALAMLYNSKQSPTRANNTDTEHRKLYNSKLLHTNTKENLSHLQSIEVFEQLIITTMNKKVVVWFIKNILAQFPKIVA